MEILKTKIKELRKLKKWSQDDLAKKINADTNQISRYETGKIIPSVETVVKLAKAFDVTTDYLITENAPKKAFNFDNSFIEYIEKIQNLNEKDKESLFHMVDALTTKNKIKMVAEGIGQ